MKQTCPPVCVFHRQRYLKSLQNIFFNLIPISHPYKAYNFCIFFNSLAINDTKNTTVKKLCSQNITSATIHSDHIFVFPLKCIQAIIYAPRCENYYIVAAQTAPNNAHISWLLFSKLSNKILTMELLCSYLSLLILMLFIKAKCLSSTQYIRPA
jgi:hypothetical protein